MSKEEHHIRQQLCTTRAKYRQGRELKAVKTYTVAQESQYILVLGLPAIHIQDKLVKSMGKYGTILEWRHLKDYPSEEFTEALLFKYQRIQSARAAKRKSDDKSFFGGVLHVCYAPEYESVEDVRRKMKDRQQAYARRLKQIEQEKSYARTVRNTTEEDEEEEEETEENETEASDQHPTSNGQHTQPQQLPQDHSQDHYPAHNPAHYPSQSDQYSGYIPISAGLPAPPPPPNPSNTNHPPLPPPPFDPNTPPPPPPFPPHPHGPSHHPPSLPPPPFPNHNPGHPSGPHPPHPPNGPHPPHPPNGPHPPHPPNGPHPPHPPNGPHPPHPPNGPHPPHPRNGPHPPHYQNVSHPHHPPPYPPGPRGWMPVPHGRGRGQGRGQNRFNPPRNRTPGSYSHPVRNQQPSHPNARDVQSRSFPLAGPAPPCGPFIPAGHKTQTEQNKPSGQKWQNNTQPTPNKPSNSSQPSTQPSQSNLIIKTFHPSKDTAKFVPRQVSKVTLPKHLTSKSDPMKSDPVSDTLKKNALTLKERAAGPELPPEIEHEHETRRAMKRKDPAMEKVMQNIRDRVRQFAEKSMLPPQLKKKKT